VPALTRETLALTAAGRLRRHAAACSSFGYPCDRSFPAADAVTIERRQQIIMVRTQGHVYSFNLSCPHENTALKWLPISRTAPSCRAGQRATWIACRSAATEPTSTLTCRTSSNRTPIRPGGRRRRYRCDATRGAARMRRYWVAAAAGRADCVSGGNLSLLLTNPTRCHGRSILPIAGCSRHQRPRMVPGTKHQAMLARKPAVSGSASLQRSPGKSGTAAT
jgi:hypothetical protein